jgi:hypothetical protein
MEEKQLETCSTVVLFFIKKTLIHLSLYGNNSFEKINFLKQGIAFFLQCYFWLKFHANKALFKPMKNRKSVSVVKTTHRS